MSIIHCQLSIIKAMAVNKNNIMLRYFFIVLVMSLIGIAVVVKAGFIMFAERQYWNDVADRFVKENKTVRPNRGNILSADGKLMASSLPEYHIYMDFMSGERDPELRRKDQHRRDSLLKANLDSISTGLHRIFPDKSKAYFKSRLQAGRRQRSRHYQLYPKRISYIEFREVQKLPYFRLGKYQSGLHEVPYNQRKKPFGSLASQTLGRLYADTAMGARNGIELAFDTVLKGRNGITHRQKVMNKWLDIIDIPPVDGCDVVTTIDVGMQDICEKALVDKLKEIDANVGVAVLMEVKTGDVKAIVNMTKDSDGNYYEMNSNAISDMLEPGSTFKTASLMVALEDGKITPETVVETGNGIKNMYGSQMRDHNWHRGGYGTITATRALEVSSNIGVSALIDKYYRNDPQKFVDGLKRMSIDQPLHLQIGGEGKPNIKGPKERYFAKTTLPWMSIGYETQIPPMNILTFYNAIANDGVMVRPKFVKEILRGDEVVKRFPTEVINGKICSDSTLVKIRKMLRGVVTDGLAKAAGSDQFAVAGKTGTAQISQGKDGYRSGKREYLVSFCGFFPAEAPQYSCIVSIRKPAAGGASGGLMAGSVFKKIAERVYAKDLRIDMAQAIDSTSNVIPTVKPGEMNEALVVLNDLDVPSQSPLDEKDGQEWWGRTESTETAVVLHETEYAANTVPNVIGMGAKDAVYLLESKGWCVRLSGVGRVRHQSLAAGTHAAKGATIGLQLRN